MLKVDCKLLQSVHLGRTFTVTPVWMGDDIVKLYIVARNGGELTIVDQSLSRVKEAQLSEDQQNAQASEDSQPPKPPSDDSDPIH